MTLIARSIPENSILELVTGFSARRRNHKLVVLGMYEPDVDPYHRQVLDAASDEVVFLGPLYDKASVQALRYHSSAYLHGHTVGGTNPSLIEAMAAGNPVIAHDNPYNRWVAGAGGAVFPRRRRGRRPDRGGARRRRRAATNEGGCSLSVRGRIHMAVGG